MTVRPTFAAGRQMQVGRHLDHGRAAIVEIEMQVGFAPEILVEHDPAAQRVAASGSVTANPSGPHAEHQLALVRRQRHLADREAGAAVEPDLARRRPAGP